jgi:hypothetical protein
MLHSLWLQHGLIPQAEPWAAQKVGDWVAAELALGALAASELVAAR